jgi:hypothetical protein
MSDDQYARLICRKHGAVYLSETEYDEQLDDPDSQWLCTRWDEDKQPPDFCGRTCEFDGDYYEDRHIPKLPEYTFDEAVAMLSSCQRDEFHDHAIGVMELGWQKEGEEIASGYFDDIGEMVTIGASSFEGEQATKLRALGTLGTKDDSPVVDRQAHD